MCLGRLNCPPQKQSPIALFHEASSERAQSEPNSPIMHIAERVARIAESSLAKLPLTFPLPSCYLLTWFMACMMASPQLAGFSHSYFISLPPLFNVIFRSLESSGSKQYHIIYQLCCVLYNISDPKRLLASE